VERRDSSRALLISLVAVLCAIGLVMVLSASSVEALHRYGGAWMFFERQMEWVALGTVCLVVAARVDYHWWRRVMPLLIAVSLGLLVVVLVPGLGITTGGSTRWIGTSQVRIQPSELAKLGVLVFLADLLARRLDGSGGVGELRFPLLVAGTAALLVLLQPDMGTSLVIGLIALSVLFVAGTPLPTMTGVMAASVLGGMALGMVESYRRARLLSFLNPWRDASNTGYQVAQSLVALGTGHLSGVGLGASRAKWGFLPNSYTDFIFAIIGEELGLLGTVLVVVLFAVFAVLGVRAALRAPDRFGGLVAAGITAWIVGQAFINIGAVIGLLPVTGVPLPFVSFGGSSLVITMVAVGILLNVVSQSSASTPTKRAERSRPPRAAVPSAVSA